jgi:hypothetical protein
VALFHFCQRQILSCANLRPINIDLVGMELILTPLIKRFYGILMDFIGNKKERFKDF